MARIKRVAFPAAKTEEEIRERVGKGTASTIYQVPISRPADVITRQSDPATLVAYSDAHQTQVAKLTSGLAFYLATVAVLAGLVWIAGELGFVLSGEAVIAVHALVILVAIPVALPGGRFGWTVGACAVIAVTVASLLWTSGETFAWGVAVLATALLNWRSTSAMTSGFKALGLMPSLDEILWSHHEEMEVFDDSSAERPLPAGVEVLNLPGNKPVFGTSPYFLLRQVEDFCFQAMPERHNSKGKVMSGLSRDNMVTPDHPKTIGPPNGSISDRPQSAIKVTRTNYDTIVAGLVEIGLVQVIPAGTVWSKIAPNSTYTCGWSIEEIRRTLQKYASS